MEITQIVPRLPPAISGVGDYAYLLARELRAYHDIQTRFLVCGPAWEGGTDLDGFSVERIDAKETDAVVRCLSENGTPSITLLHYVGYGYQERGCPFWLVRGLEAWRKEHEARRLVTMFHELYAFGPPWRSSFWALPLQRSITARLAAVSDTCRTNMTRSARTITRLAPRHRGRVKVQPVFSNVGESEKPTPFNARQRWLVIFGGGGWITSAFTTYRDELQRACRCLEIKKMIVIGLSARIPRDVSVPVEVLGALSASDTSRLMQQAQAGFTAYPTAYLGKSTIFAAYAAHGILPVVPRSGESEDALVVGKTLMTAGDLSTQVPAEQIIDTCARAFAWYRPHNLHETGLSYAASLHELLIGRLPMSAN